MAGEEVDYVLRHQSVVKLIFEFAFWFVYIPVTFVWLGEFRSRLSLEGFG